MIRIISGRYKGQKLQTINSEELEEEEDVSLPSKSDNFPMGIKRAAIVTPYAIIIN